MLGFITAMLAAFAGLLGLVKRSVDQTPKGRLYRIMFGFSIGHMMVAFFERFFFNVGNPTSSCSSSR